MTKEYLEKMMSAIRMYSGEDDYRKLRQSITTQLWDLSFSKIIPWMHPKEKKMLTNYIILTVFRQGGRIGK
jgi:hypothetical protein